VTKRAKSNEAQLGLQGAGGDLLKEADAARRASELRLVDPRKIHPPRVQARQEFADDRLADLVESIRAHGVLQPLLARQRPNGVLELLAGERRQRAAILAGLKRVPIRILDVSDEAAVAISLTENLARADLSAWEEAVGIAQLRDSLTAIGRKLTRDELAVMVGRSSGAVSESLLIADRLSPVLPLDGISGQSLTGLPKTALHAASRGEDAKERAILLRLAVQKAAKSEAPGKAVAEARRRRGRPLKAFTVSDRLSDRGTLSFNLRRRPEEMAREEAAGALARLTPLVDALRNRAEGK